MDAVDDYLATHPRVTRWIAEEGARIGRQSGMDYRFCCHDWYYPYERHGCVSTTDTDWRWPIRIMVAATIIIVALLILTEPSDAATPRYCDEAWRYSHSAGAAACRADGWTIRPHFTISPRNRLRATDLPPCASDDGEERGCYWNARRRGNHRGDSFVVSMRGELFYVAFQ